MDFLTKSGQRYYYDRHSNRIGMSPFPNPIAPIKRFESTEINKNPIIEHFCIEMTQQCNFRCSYCCYSGNYRNWRSHKNVNQSEENLDKIITFISQYSTVNDRISVSFYGGEALLEFEKIKYITVKLRSLYGSRVSFSLTTNGYLLSNPIVDFIFSVPDFNIIVTLDGDSYMHDSNRKLADGSPTFSKIFNNLLTICQSYPDEYVKRVNFISTIKNTTDLRKLNDVWMANSFLSRKLPLHISTIFPNFQLSTPDLKIELKRDVFYEALNHYLENKNDILTNELIKQTDRIKNREIFDMDENCQKVSTCFSDINQCFIDCNGNIATCEQVCDNVRIGSIHNGFDFGLITDLSNRYTDFLNERCRDCWNYRLCQLCPKYLELKDSEMDIICEKEKQFSLLLMQLFCEIVEKEI